MLAEFQSVVGNVDTCNLESFAEAQKNRKPAGACSLNPAPVMRTRRGAFRGSRANIQGPAFLCTASCTYSELVPEFYIFAVLGR